MANINDNYFDGHYKEIWRALTPEGLTNAEVDFLVTSSNLKAGGKVLDLMCGYGRHALALARKGMEVTGADNLADYVKEVNQIAATENLPIKILQQDVLQFQPIEKYDLSICMGNSLSFFNHAETLRLFSIISSSLNQGQKFIFNSLLIAEIAIKEFRERLWEYIGDLKWLYEGKYFFSPSRIETESIFITLDGKTELKKGIDYIYSLNEVEAMLKETGFMLKEVWSIPGKKKFTIGEPRAYFVAEKG